MRRRLAIGAVAGIVVLGLGYEALDVYDVVPGPLTLADSTRTPVAQPGSSSAGPSVAAPQPSASASSSAGLTGPEQSAAKVKAKLASALKDSDLATTVGLDIRDAKTGAVLEEQNQDKAMTPASTTKLLTAFVVANSMDMDKTLTTKVVSGSSDGRIVLVAGGDTMLNPGKGDADAVSGHAGLADLAAKVATSLKKQGRTSVELDVDTSYAPGPLTAKHWDAEEVATGYAARIAQLGLSTQRATDPATPTTSDPVGSTQEALVKALKAKGITATKGSNVTAAAGSSTLGSVQSAPVIDVLGLALQDSDNAMIESLARQAAFRHGVGGSTAKVAGFVEKTLKEHGFDLTGVKLQDVSGLSRGTTIPPRLLTDVLLAGTQQKNRPMAQVISRLSVGGFDGTLDDRFQRTTNSSAAGEVRAKTGSLPEASSLAGTVVTDDKRVLVFAIISNGTQPNGSYATRAAIDDVIADLASCGCSASSS